MTAYRNVVVSGSRKRARGFTLVELLVVITVIGILVGLLLPAVQAAREAARRVGCGNNLRQIGIALQGYHATYKAFPPGCQDHRKKRIAWSVYLLPFLEQPAVYGQFKFNAPYNAAENREAVSHVVSTYLCPSTTRREKTRIDDITTSAGFQRGCTDYGGIFGYSSTGEVLDNGVMIWDCAISVRDIRDGASRTLIVAEDTGRGWAMDGEWANGENIFMVTGPPNVEQNNELWSDHPGGIYTLFCDGAACFLRDAIDLKTLSAICTRADGDCADPNELP
jgi:prepilin-type N-terminal cleavage/methylation domain-containing protein